jgi:PAS domain-containing protein
MDLTVYKALFRCSPYPYLVMDTKMVIIGASGSYLRSVQRTEGDIVGKYLFDAFPPNPDDPESTNMTEVRASIARALTKAQPDTTPFLRYSIPVDSPSGVVYEERYWSTVHTPVLDDDGNPIFLFQNAIDVTSLYRFNRSSKTPSRE